MNDVRKALIYGIENPPREYTLEEWAIISEYASYVATKYDESQRPFEQALNGEVETFEDRCKREYENIQRGKKEFAKGKIGRFGEPIPADDVIYKEPIDIKPIRRINIDDIKAIDCEDGTVYADNEKGLPNYERPIHIDNVRPIKDDRVAEVRIEFKCADCKYRDCEANEYPCNECEKSSKFTNRKMK